MSTSEARASEWLGPRRTTEPPRWAESVHINTCLSFGERAIRRLCGTARRRPRSPCRGPHATHGHETPAVYLTLSIRRLCAAGPHFCGMMEGLIRRSTLFVPARALVTSYVTQISRLAKWMRYSLVIGQLIFAGVRA